MASAPEVVFPAEIKKSIEAPRPPTDGKKGALTTDLELIPSEKEGEVDVIIEGDYTPEQYKKVLRKIGPYYAFSYISSRPILTTIRSIPPSFDVVLLRRPTDRQDLARHTGNLRPANRHGSRRAAVQLADDYLLHHVPLRRVPIQLPLAKMVARKISEHIHVLLG